MFVSFSLIKADSLLFTVVDNEHKRTNDQFLFPVLCSLTRGS